MTEEHSQGPLLEIPFTIGGSSFTLNPSDEPNYTDISLIYDLGISFVEDFTQNRNNFLTIWPNPAKNLINIDFSLETNEFVSIDIYDQKFNLVDKLVTNKYFSEGKNTINRNINSRISPGTYYIMFSTKAYVCFGKKLIISK